MMVALNYNIVIYWCSENANRFFFCSMAVFIRTVVVEKHWATYVQGYKFTKIWEIYQGNIRYYTYKYVLQLDFTFTVNTEQQNEQNANRWMNEGHCSCAYAHYQLKSLYCSKFFVMTGCVSHLLINTFHTSIFRRVHFSRNMVTAWMIHAERPAGSVLIMTCIHLSDRNFAKWKTRWVPSMHTNILILLDIHFKYCSYSPNGLK